ncbi:MAG: FadR family transcriptional regulator [Spirochaetales bacterium]|nr:FadR family transcriptional regulator [Spirochaetales bacterium]
MEELFKIAEPRISAVDTVVEKIKSLLIEKRLNPGDMIPSETILSEQLGVSRGSIREAMKILSAYGIIDVRRGAGTFISDSSNKKIFDPLLFKILVSNANYKELIEIREMMEKGVVNLIINNSSDEDIELLKLCMKEFDEAENLVPRDRIKADEIDLKYHRLMGRLTHNHIVENIYNFVVDLFAPTINADLGYIEHREMHQAIVDRDLSRAMIAVETHTKAWIKHHQA